MNYIVIKKDSDFLVHHGIKGQKWGVRRYQNYDGSLKPAGEKRYDVNDANDANDANDHSSTIRKGKEKAKKILKGVGIGIGITAATAAVAYGGLALATSSWMNDFGDILIGNITPKQSFWYR